MIPVRYLWSGFPEGVVVILRGYIDESYDGEKIPKMFSLTCTFAHTSEWPWIEMAWEKCLEEKNESLRRQGRTPLRRYHSVDMNNFKEDFKDWDGPERQEFCEKLVRVISRHTCGYEGYLINLQELAKEWPEAGPDYKAFAYGLLLKCIMFNMGTGVDKHLKDHKITLFHERCEYDGVLLESFNEVVNDPTVENRKYFTTIAPMGWENCTPLQPADLMAYENFKEGLRQLPNEKPRPRRTILSELISLETFSVRLRYIDLPSIIKLKNLYATGKYKSGGNLSR